MIGSYNLLQIGKILFALIFLALSLRVVWLFVRCDRAYMLADMADAFRPSRMKRKGRFLLYFLVAACVLSLLAAEDNRQEGSRLVALIYPEASSGLNPNGSRCNMSDILSDEVLNRAIANGGFEGLDADDLKDALHVQLLSAAETKQSGSAPGGNSGNAESGFSGNPTEAGLVSTQFLLEYSPTSKTGGLDGEDVVFAVTDAYRDWFIEQYAINYGVLDISFDDIDEYDYPELRDYFRAHLNKITNFAGAYAKRNGTFVSEQTGMSFWELAEKGWNLYNTSLEDFHSYVLSYGLSKDGEKSMDKIRYMHIASCRNYLNNIQAYDVRLDAINRYDNDMAAVVYVPTYDTDGSFYMSKTKIGIDHFSEGADMQSNYASGILSTIQDEDYLIGQLSRSTGGSEQYQKADAQIEQLKGQILDLAEALRKTARDYEDTVTNGYVSISKPRESVGPAAAVVLALSLCTLILLYCHSALSGLGKQLKSRKDVSK